MVIDEKSRARQGDGVLSKATEDGLVLLKLDGGEYYTLNEVGRAVWELCDGEQTVESMVASIVAAYDAPAEVVRRDVLDLVSDLKRENLVVETR